MPTYVNLFTHTDHGKQNIETIPTEVLPLAEELTREFGGELKDLYYGSVGEYDGFAVVEVPDGKSIEQFRIAFEQEGTHHLENYEVFEADEYFELLGEAAD